MLALRVGVSVFSCVKLQAHCLNYLGSGVVASLPWRPDRRARRPDRGARAVSKNHGRRQGWRGAPPQRP